MKHHEAFACAKGAVEGGRVLGPPHKDGGVLGPRSGVRCSCILLNTSRLAVTWAEILV